MHLQKEMTESEVKHFFSQTTEFIVETVKPDTYLLHCGGKYLTMYKPTVQTLIREIYQLGTLADKG